MTFRQKCQRQVLLKNKSNCLFEFISSYESSYNYYLKVIEDYEELDKIPYPKREKLIRLITQYRRAELSYRKSLRDIYNFDVIVYDEEREYQLSAKELRDFTKQSERIYREFMNRKKIHRVK